MPTLQAIIDFQIFLEFDFEILIMVMIVLINHHPTSTPPTTFEIVYVSQAPLPTSTLHIPYMVVCFVKIPHLVPDLDLNPKYVKHNNL